MAQVEIVAEISNSHNGSLLKAMELVQAAKDAGADAIKLQCFTLEEIYALRGENEDAPPPWQHYTKRELYKLAQTPLEWFPTLVYFCKTIGMPWFSTVMGKDSLALLESLDCPRYKMASYEAQQTDLREMIQATGKPLIRSWYHDHTLPHSAPDKVLYCPPGYPAQVFRLAYLRNGFDGISLHCNGVLGMKAASVATGMGIRMLEAHIVPTHPNYPGHAGECLDQAFGFVKSGFESLVDVVRKTEELL